MLSDANYPERSIPAEAIDSDDYRSEMTLIPGRADNDQPSYFRPISINGEADVAGEFEPKPVRHSGPTN